MTKPAAVPTTTPTPSAAVPSKTVSGYTVQVTAFIPISPDDLKMQAEIPMLLLDIKEGRKSFSALEPNLKQVEFRQEFIRKRVPAEVFSSLMEKAPVVALGPQDPENATTEADGSVTDEA
jgi:hypothetical protein